MVLVSYSGREINSKIVYYGPGLSGKTTNLEAIFSSIPEANKGRMVSVKTKTERTLFFDFLPVHLGELAGFKTRFLLYTVPGQVYYNATRKLVLKGVDAVVFVADSQRSKMDENKESLLNLSENLREQGLSIDDIPLVIQYNKRDVPGAMPIEEMNAILNREGVPHYPAVAKDGEGVLDTFKAISRLLLRHLSKEIGVQIVPPPEKTAAEASGSHIAREIAESPVAAGGSTPDETPVAPPRPRKAWTPPAGPRSFGPAPVPAPPVPRPQAPIDRHVHETAPSQASVASGPPPDTDVTEPHPVPDGRPSEVTIRPRTPEEEASSGLGTRFRRWFSRKDKEFEPHPIGSVGPIGPIGPTSEPSPDSWAGPAGAEGGPARGGRSESPAGRPSGSPVRDGEAAVETSAGAASEEASRPPRRPSPGRLAPEPQEIVVPVLLPQRRSGAPLVVKLLIRFAGEEQHDGVEESIDEGGNRHVDLA